MSFDVSWAAFQGGHKAEILALAGLRDTGERVEIPEQPFCWATLPGGWLLLYANDSTYAPSNINSLSANHAVLSLTIQEYVPLSMAAFHVRGECVWSLFHGCQKGVYDLVSEGELPPQTVSIRDKLIKKQQENTDEPSAVDYVYDIPVELAASICGFRHDRFIDDLLFTVAEPI